MSSCHQIFHHLTYVLDLVRAVDKVDTNSQGHGKGPHGIEQIASALHALPDFVSDGIMAFRPVVGAGNIVAVGLVCHDVPDVELAHHVTRGSRVAHGLKLVGGVRRLGILHEDVVPARVLPPHIHSFDEARMTRAAYLVQKGRHVIHPIVDDQPRLWSVALPPFGQLPLGDLQWGHPSRKIEMARKKAFDESGVRTHASEDMAALTPRLRPLGHLTVTPIKCDYK
jgi:hypothetical protein